ncbi:MAG: hypothetical protein WCV63_11300 [Negativicutes bacterium]
MNENLNLEYRIVKGKHNTYNRGILYEEVWEQPVVAVAIKYGVSNVAIHKICKTLNIPTPPRGYWARVRAGAKLEKAPLPKTKVALEVLGSRTFEGVKAVNALLPKLNFLTESERSRVLLAARSINMSAKNVRVHKKIVAYKSVIKEWNEKDRKPEMAQRKFGNFSRRLPFMAGVISKESLPRVYRILSVLFCQLEKLGCSVNDDLSLQIRNEHVSFEIEEAQDKVKHVITKQETQAMLLYEDAKQRYRWAAKPQIRQYDYIFNGRLRIKIRQGRYFRETDSVNVESRLCDMLIELYEKSEEVRSAREKQEEDARNQAEKARLREERRERYNREVERIRALENASLDFETADRIRAYVKAVVTSRGQNGLDDETAVWVDWAMKKADWFDPIVARNDELFGKREHNKNLKDKTLEKVVCYW